ncbi:MAG: hypothetical protein IJ666_03480 [Ruminococcus sp.]|nr:hypothetical protein [Ruminococcus sp.]
MKKSYVKKFVSVANSLLLSITALSPNVINAREEISERCILAVRNEGECDVVYTDENGNEISPVLIPDYGDRAGNYPSKYDLRAYDAVTSVKDQYPTSCCWAYAALASAESNLIMKGYADSSIDLSEAHLIWFGDCKASTDENDPLFSDGENNGISGYNLGGSNMTAIETLARWNGALLEKNTPPATDMPELDESQRYLSDAHLQNSYIIDTADTDTIKSHIVQMGACMASYYDADEYFSEKNSSYYCNEKSRTNHAVNIIGWDDNYSRNNFISPPEKNGAWLCKNSWGDDWGNGGYFYLSYYDTNLARVTFFEMENADNYDRNYQYDGTVSHYRFFENSGIAAANVFRTAGDERLSAVSFNTLDADNPYIIRIYRDIKDAGNPTSGELVSEQKGNIPYAGYHTVKLHKPVFLPEDTSFSAVVMFEKTGSVFYMDECPTDSGVSFYAPYYSEDGYTGKWWDSCTRIDSNVCIKAFTNSGVEINSETFPDENFRQFISDNFDSDGDSFITDGEIKSINEINAANLGISDFTGITYFKNLESFDCSRNPISELDLNGLDNMKSLVCGDCIKVCDKASCTEISQNIGDISKISDITGASAGENGRLMPTDNNISYTYDCGNGMSARLRIFVSEINHKNCIFKTHTETAHTIVCTDCGYSEEQEHEFTEYMQYDEKSHAKFCKQCGEVIMSGHDFGDYTISAEGIKSHECEICGYEESEEIIFTRGDITGDDTTDVFDLIALRKAVIDGIDGERENLACDVNADGKINISDLVALSNYIMGKSKSL